MNESAFIGAAVVIALFLLSHLGLAIWFASGMTAEVKQIRTDVTAAATAITLMADMNTRISLLEQRMARAETDMRETLKAAALLGAAQKK